MSEVCPGNFEQHESESSHNLETSQKKKMMTQAQIMGKTAGRWTKEEHKKFVQGKILTQILKIFYSFKNLRKRLEARRRICIVSLWRLNSLARLKVFY